jgi:hypothetical protein
MSQVSTENELKLNLISARGKVTYIMASQSAGNLLSRNNVAVETMGRN